MSSVSPCIFQAATKILARQLVRLRQQIANLQSSRAQMRGIATHTQVHNLIVKLINVFLVYLALVHTAMGCN